MIKKSMQNALNEQIKNEIQSAYLYLGMALYAESSNLPGVGAWLRVQWGEELEHAMKLVGIVNDRGGRVTLQALAAPKASYASVLDVFQNVLAHEQKVLR
jgi:ferritin